MPFDSALNNVYDAVQNVVEDYCGLTCLRADEIAKPERITEDIWAAINESRFLIADLTNLNPNVFYEVGLAHALNKPVILMTQGQDIPFDLRQVRYLEYDQNRLTVLRRTLPEYVKSCISTIPRDWKQSFTPHNWDGSYIKITSLEAPPAVHLSNPFEITVTARNNGRDAYQGYFSISFPDGAEDLSVESNTEIMIGKKGDQWKNGEMTLKYPITEGYKYGEEPVWESGREYKLKVRGYAKRKGFFWFYVNACCYDGIAKQWSADPQVCLVDVDQRSENVYCGVIDIK